MSINNMQQLFMHDLARMLEVEKIIAENLRQMVKQVEHPEFRASLSAHETETRHQIETINEIFHSLGQQPKTIKCESAEALVKEFKETAKAITDPEIKDLAVTMAAQKVEHLEISAYRSLITAAEELGNQNITHLLQQNLRQEERMAQQVERFSRLLIPVHH